MQCFTTEAEGFSLRRTEFVNMALSCGVFIKKKVSKEIKPVQKFEGKEHSRPV
jgi:hypothetical protein